VALQEVELGREVRQWEVERAIPHGRRPVRDDVVVGEDESSATHPPITEAGQRTMREGGFDGEF
jgi:hypothetical protein